MYALHVPANLVFPPNVSFEPEEEFVQWEYDNFEMRGAQTTVLVFDFLALWGLYLFGKRFADRKTGLLLALIFALNPYILGFGGAFGLQQASHIGGIPFIVFALAFVTQPFLAGILLGIGSGMLYYPVLLFPLWFGYYLRIGKILHAIVFLIAFAAVGFFSLYLINTMTVPGSNHESMSPLQAFVSDTIYQQQFKPGYGSSRFSFWGQYPKIAEWAKPLTGISYLFFCLYVAFVPRKMNLQLLVTLTAAILIGTQLVLSHGGGTYIGFYIAPFIITLFGRQKNIRNSLR